MADRFRGMGKTALIAVACISGAGAVPIMLMLLALADGLMALTSPDTTPIERVSVLLSWLPMLVMMVITPQSTPGSVGLVGTAVLTATLAVRMQLPQPTMAQPAGRARAGYERLALATALVVPVSTHDLRESLIVRAACLLGACAFALMLIARHAPDIGLATGLLIGLMAVASVTLYRLPMMIRSIVLDLFDFLAGHREFRRRITAFAVVPPAALFLICVGASWEIARRALPAGASDLALPAYPLYFYACLFVSGALATIWSRKLARWVIPTAHFALTMILLMVALT
ncbi:MAG: hypothetical protein ABIO61_11110 [Thermomonas sp.]